MATNIPDGALFNWYRVESLLKVQASEVPQIFKNETIENLPVEIHFSQMPDFEPEVRSAITILYNGVYIPLGLYDYYPYYKSGYAVDLRLGVIYLGVEVAA